MMKTFRFLLFPAMLLAVLTFAGCTPARQGALDNTFYASGIPNVRIDVAPPLQLAAQGIRWTSTPNNVSIEQPFTSFRFAAYAENNADPVARSAHVIVSGLPDGAWQFSPETWKDPATFSLSNNNVISGKFWIVQTRVVVARGDWFSDLWTANGRQVPPVWLAMRWSSNPNLETRVVAEYREAAPQCIIDAMTGDGVDKNGLPALLAPDVQTLRGRCMAHIDAFEARAVRVFSLNRLKSADMPDAMTATRFVLPDDAPDIRKLVGEVEPIERSDPKP
jgi:hypothetical protein